MKFVIAVFLLNYLFYPGICSYPCKLLWVPYSYGDDVPTTSVHMSESQLIARLNLSTSASPESNIHLTTVRDRDPIVVYDGRINNKYELLTNPFGCNLLWKSEPELGLDSGYHVQINHRGVLARSFTNMTWIPTSLNDIVAPQNSQYLISSAKFQVELTHVTYLRRHEPPTIKDISFEFLSQDVIDNRSPIEISQTVLHTKDVARTNFEEVIGEEFETTMRKVFHDTYPIITTNITIEGGGKSNMKGSSTNMANQISISRSLLISPNTKVEVCSLIRSLDITVPYKLEARFTLPGHKGNKIREVVLQRGFPYEIERIEEDAVISSIMGKRKDVYELETRIFVFHGAEGCSLLRNAVEGWKAFKYGFNFTNDEYYREILQQYFEIRF